MTWRAKRFGQHLEQASQDRFKAPKASDLPRKCKERKHKEKSGASTWHNGEILEHKGKILEHNGYILEHNRVDFVTLPKSIIGRF